MKQLPCYYCSVQLVEPNSEDAEQVPASLEQAEEDADANDCAANQAEEAHAAADDYALLSDLLKLDTVGLTC